VRTGKPAVGEIFGAPLFAYLQSAPDKAALFHAGLGNRGRIEAPAILNAYDFAACRRVVDLGGGNGAFLSAILAKHPGDSGVLLERGAAITAARGGQGGALPRCDLIEGDYFKAVPPGGDVYMLKRVLFGMPRAGAAASMQCSGGRKRLARSLARDLLQPIGGAAPRRLGLPPRLTSCPTPPPRSRRPGAASPFHPLP
jgi:hypothetical protein